MSKFQQLPRVFVVLVVTCPTLAGVDGVGDPGPVPIEVKVDGAVLHYALQEIPKARRSARGEIEMIERATASLRVERPILVRRSSLPPGDYDVRVESEDGKSHFLRIVPVGSEAVEGKAVSPPKRGKKTPPRAAKTEGALEEKMEEKAEAKEGAKPASKAREMPENAPSDSGDEKREATPVGSEAEGKAENEHRAARKPAPHVEAAPLAEICAPLALSPCEKQKNSVAFDLKSAAKGSKLRIIVRAGGTEGRATVRFGEKK